MLDGRRTSRATRLFMVAALLTTVLATSRQAGAAPPASVRFDGASSIVSVPDRAALRLTTNLTIEARAKPLAAPRPSTIAGKSFYELTMYPAAGGVQFTMEVRIGTTWREARSTTYPLGQWYAVAGTYDGSRLRVFVNGELVGESAVTGAVTTSTRPFYIGSVEGSGDIFNGNVDEVRVSNVVRYAGNYAVLGTPFTTDANTLGLWHLDEANGTTTVDDSGNGGTGTLLNGATWSADSPFIGNDSVPPVITAVNATAITGSTATITWTTDEASTSQVEYGTTTAYGSSTPLDLAGVTAHSAGLSGLTLSTTYHYRVKSRDGSGNEAVSADAVFVTGSSDPRAAVGAWDPVRNWPLVAVHMVQLHTGEYLVFDAWEIPARPRLWNPVTDTFTDVPVPAGIFCAGHSVLPDGKVVIVGGHAGGEVGIRDAFLFDPVTRAFTRLPNMAYARWYPSATTLGDGRVVVLSGNITPSTWADTPEIFDPATNTFSQLTGVNTSDMHEEEYPLSFLMPDGKVFTIISSTGNARLLDVNARTWTALGVTNAFNGAAVQYRPGKILTTGGGNTQTGGPSLTRAEVMDVGLGAQWRQVPSMSQPRYMHNLVMLADGKVMAIGGASTASQTTSTGTLIPEIWDPTTEGWTDVAPMAHRRMYHSTALLLPDGRMLTAGGGRLPPAPDIFSMQIYNPPYLFKGPRPTITGAPSAITRGAGIPIVTPDAASVSAVHLVRLASVTHTLDQDQHFVPLSFSASGGTVTATAPTSTGVAPGGYYMLFIVNDQGVPSVAKIVHLSGSGGPPPDTQPPTASVTAPSAGATVSGAVTVTAVATDNIGVTGVQFKLDGANLGGIDTTSPYSVSWDTTAAPNGAHTITAVASDAAANSTTATPVGVTVDNNVADTTPPVISALAASTITRNGAIITWTTNEASTSQADYGPTTAYGSSTPLDPPRVTAHSINITGLASDTEYHVRVRSADAAGNTATSGNLTLRTVGLFGCNITAPANGATVSATVTLTAATLNAVGGATVQFTVDGVNVGAPDGTAPYSVTWDSSTAAAGPHTVAAVATDGSGATINASPVTVTVDNSRPTPVAAFAFNETTGTTAADATGNGHTGTVTAGTWAAAGRNGGAISFSGTGWVTIADSPRLRGGTAVTVEAWARPTATQGSTWRTLVLKERTGGLAYALYANGSASRPGGWVNTGGADLEARGTTALPVNAWTHLAFTFDGVTDRFYVNGVLVASTPASGSIVASSGPLRVGGNSVWGERFRGLIDDVRVYDTVLTPSQIQTDMATPV